MFDKTIKIKKYAYKKLNKNNHFVIMSFTYSANLFGVMADTLAPSLDSF